MMRRTLANMVSFYTEQQSLDVQEGLARRVQEGWFVGKAPLGEVPYRGEWYEGKHEPIIDRSTWNRVQSILGMKVYRSHELTYAGSLIHCGHCGHFITGEQVTKKLKLEGCDRTHHEIANLAVKVLELSQHLREQWVMADYPEKRQILEILCLNLELRDASLYVELRKPFDVLAEGLLVPSSRAGGI